MAIKDVPSYYLGVLYLNPIFWCFQSLACNEFLSDKYRCVQTSQPESQST